GGGVFVQTHAQRLRRGGLAQGQVEWMQVARTGVEQPAQIALRANYFVEAGLGDLSQRMGVAEALEVGILLLEVVQVSRFGRQVAVAPGQIAVDAVALDALADDLDGLEAHALERVHAVFADHRGELLDVVAHSANQLAAFATTGSPAETPCLEQDHRQTALVQFDRGIEPGETAADDADIGRLLTLQARQLERSVDA